MLISQRRSFPRGRISHVRLEKEGEAEAAAAAAEKAVLDPDLSISFSWVKHFFSASSFLFLSLFLSSSSLSPRRERNSHLFGSCWLCRCSQEPRPPAPWLPRGYPSLVAQRLALTKVNRRLCHPAEKTATG